MKFDHNTMTPFPLVGQHVSLSCASCHKSLVFSDAKSNCISCHTDVHKGSLGVHCQNCHTPQTWVVSNIEQIHERTRFPLVGAHQNVDCASCHTQYSQLYFPPISTACITCHSQQYYSTTAPNHVQAGFSTQCQSCHTVVDVSWGPTNFNHSFFPLTGGHAIANCFACHKQGTSNNFTGLSTNCYSCHSPQFAATTSPNHVAAGFPRNCAQCHTITTWTTATFDHNTTGFPLTGEHANLQCQQCHTNGYAVAPSTTCATCHQTDYNNATTPVNHVAAGLPTTCQTCHATTALFTTTTFVHPSTPFALTGAHTTVQCQSCHKGSVTNTPTDCYSCHQTDYANTTNPPHSAQGFPTTCTQCHSTTDWTSATFNHNTTGFPLTGAHTSVQCAQCHTNGYATPPPTQCVACHQTDYNNTTNPPHASAGYPTECTQCHTTTAWTPSTFNHTQFPITAGTRHGVPPLLCSDCHTDITTFAIFSCTNSACHTQAETDKHHSGVSGYVYSPTSCYTCHPTGKGD